MSNPALALINWIEGFPLETQDEITFLVCASHPSFSADIDNIFKSKEYSSKILELLKGSTSGDFKDIGVIVSFRALFDYFFLAKRGTKEGWDETVKLFDSVINDPSEKPAGVVEQAKEMKDKVPERMAQWIAICDSWKQLKLTSLSDDEIEQWHNAQAFSTYKPV